MEIKNYIHRETNSIYIYIYTYSAVQVVCSTQNMLLALSYSRRAVVFYLTREGDRPERAADGSPFFFFFFRNHFYDLNTPNGWRSLFSFPIVFLFFFIVIAADLDASESFCTLFRQLLDYTMGSISTVHPRCLGLFLFSEGK